MARLLIIHHTPSPVMHSMFERVVAGANHPEIKGVEVISRAALTASPVDVLDADGYILGSPANLGYLSGALKTLLRHHLLPVPDRNDKAGRLVLFLHGNDDCTGALQAAAKITTGLSWQQCQHPVVVTGAADAEDLDRCWELGAAVAATIAP